MERKANAEMLGIISCQGCGHGNTATSLHTSCDIEHQKLTAPNAGENTAQLVKTRGGPATGGGRAAPGGAKHGLAV